MAFAAECVSGVLGSASLPAIVSFGTGTVIAGGVFLSTLGRRLSLADHYFESRDWLFRTERIPYESVERIDFRREHQLTIWVAGGRRIHWPSKTSGIESFISEFSERVTRVRLLQFSGDLETE